MRKGILEMLVLQILSKQKEYGYSIVSRLKEESNNKIDIKEGTLYPILYRLEDAKLIKSVWEESENRRGVPRKYYIITKEGQSSLEKMVADYLNFISGIEYVFKVGE